MPTIVSNVEFRMIHRDLTDCAVIDVPAPYALRFFQPSDVDVWLSIQRAAETFDVPDADTFFRSIGSDLPALSQRLLFLLDSDANPIGTITAWNDSKFAGLDIGRIHWLAVMPDSQRKGLGSALLSAACQLLLRLGYRQAWLWTSTGRTAAINLYLRFGFEPVFQSNGERDAFIRAGYSSINGGRLTTEEG